LLSDEAVLSLFVRVETCRVQTSSFDCSKLINSIRDATVKCWMSAKVDGITKVGTCSDNMQSLQRKQIKNLFTCLLT